MKFHKGMTVQVWTQGNIWRDAVLTQRSAPAKSGDGWYYIFDPLPGKDPTTGVMLSQGGWTSERLIRERR